MLTLHTPRIFLRPLTVADAPDFYALNLDPEVLRYTGDRPFANVAAAAAFLSSYDQYQRYGVGRLAVVAQEGGAFLGWCGLKYTPELEEYDIGFRFFKMHWGQGYATEAARACLDFGFAHLGLPRVVGRAMKANAASIRVLEKLGMHPLRDFDFDGHGGVVYALDAPQGNPTRHSTG